jgi:hypothetical protein
VRRPLLVVGVAEQNTRLTLYGDAFAGTFVMVRTLWPRTRYFTPPPP